MEENINTQTKKSFDWRSPLSAFIWGLSAIIIVSIIVGGALAWKGMEIFKDLKVEVVGEERAETEGPSNFNIDISFEKPAQN